MATSTEIKSNNNTLIRVKTTAKSITKGNVADQLDAGIDYTVQEVALKLDKYFTTYKAKLSQSGTSAPTAVVLKNDTGKTFTYERVSTGSYKINFSSIYLDLNKIDIYIHLQSGSYVAPQVLIENLNIFATIETKYWDGSTFALSDTILQNSTLYLVVND